MINSFNDPRSTNPDPRSKLSGAYSMYLRSISLLLIIFTVICLPASDLWPQVSSRDEIPQDIQYLEKALEETRQARNLYIRLVQDTKAQYSETLEEDYIPNEILKINIHINDLRTQRDQTSGQSWHALNNKMKDSRRRINQLNRIKSIYNNINSLTRNILSDINSLAGQYVRLAGKRERIAAGSPAEGPDRPLFYANADTLFEKARKLYVEALEMQEQKIAEYEDSLDDVHSSNTYDADSLLRMANNHMAASGMRNSANGIINSIINCIKNRLRIQTKLTTNKKDLSNLEQDISALQLQIQKNKQRVRSNYERAEQNYLAAAHAFSDAAKNEINDERAARMRMRARSAFHSAYSVYRRLHG
ncbi:hypothetical protein ACFL54_02615 [Planctomycetota bacterium]